MSLIRIEAAHEVTEVDGEVLAGPVTTRYNNQDVPRPRWVEASIVRRASGGFVLHIINHSRVWHLPDGSGHVRQPGPAAYADLPPDAVYCGFVPAKAGRPACPAPLRSRVSDPFALGPRPGPLPVPPDRVVTELPQFKTTWHDDWNALLGEVANSRRPGTVTTAMSGPMQELITAAIAADPSLALVSKPVRRA